MKGCCLIFLACALLLAGVAPAYAESSSAIQLSGFRAVRVGSTTISLSFVSKEMTIGKVSFTEDDGSSISLTDSVAQIDHLFTIEDLSISHAYSFNVTASKGSDMSDTYVVLLSPDTIGKPGQSIIPTINVLDASGDKLYSINTASTTPDTVRQPSIWSFIVTGIGLGGALLAYRFIKRRNAA